MFPRAVKSELFITSCGAPSYVLTVSCFSSYRGVLVVACRRGRDDVAGITRVLVLRLRFPSGITVWFAPLSVLQYGDGVRKRGGQAAHSVVSYLHSVDAFRGEGELVEPNLVSALGGGDLVTLGRQGRLERRD